MVILAICCYCLKEKNADEEAKVYYYKNVQKESAPVGEKNVERVKLIDPKKNSIVGITRISPRSQ